HDLFVCEVFHYNRIERAFGGTGSTTGTGSRVYGCCNFALHIKRNRPVRTYLGASTADFAFFGNNFCRNGVGEHFSTMEQANDTRCSGGPLGDRLLYVFGSLGASGEENAPCGRVNRLELGVGFQEKSVRRELKSKHLLEFLRRFGRFHADRQHQHVKIMEGYLSSCAVVDGNPQPSFGGFNHIAGQTPYILHAKTSALCIEVLETFSESTDVDIKDLYVYFRIVFLQDQGALDSVHTADI